jgi:hypothetical protein
MPFDATPTEIKTVEETLRRALQVLEQKGWCQGALARDRYGVSVDCFDVNAESVCMIGALHLAIPSKQIGITDAANALGDIIRDSIALWNDRPGRTKDEVIAMFKAAIEKARDS